MYSLALVIIMQWTGGILRRRRREDFCPPWRFKRYLAAAEGEHSLRPRHFVRVAFQLTRLGTKAAYGLRHCSGVKYQVPNDI